MSHQLNPIAIFKSCYQEKFGTPCQGPLVPSSLGCIEFLPPYDDKKYVEGLHEYSHLWLIGAFHLNPKSQKKTVRRPRWLGQKCGVFASRSPFRPNPLSLSLVKIEQITSQKIHVSGIDLVDQTPILDIKPYISTYDKPKSSFYAQPPAQKKFSVRFSAEAKTNIANLPLSISPQRFASLIRQTLCLDPRPLSSKKRTAPEDFGVFISGYNVVFSFRNNKIFVKDVEQIPTKTVQRVKKKSLVLTTP